MTMDLSGIVTGAPVLASVLRQPHEAALVQSGYLINGSDFAGWIPLRGAQLAAPLPFTTAVAGLALAGALVSVTWLQTQADPTFDVSAGISSSVTFNPTAGSVNHMESILGIITVDGSFGAAQPNVTVGQQIAGRFRSKTASTRTADVGRLVGVSGSVSHNSVATIVNAHAYDAFASALAGTVQSLTCYDTNQSVGNGSHVNTARLHWLTPPSFFSGGTADVTVGIEIDNWPGGNPNPGITPWSSGSWGSAYAIRAAAGHVSLMGPLSVGTANLPLTNQLAQFVSTTPNAGALVQVNWTQTQPDPTAAWPTVGGAPVVSGALVVGTTYTPTAGGAANSMNSFYGHIYADGAENLGTIVAVKGQSESPAGTTRSGTMLRLAGGQFAATKRDTAAGLVTFVEGVLASASVLGGNVTNVSAYNLTGTVNGGAQVGTWRSIWLAKPSFSGGGTQVTTTVGLDIDDYSTFGANAGVVYAIRVAGGLSYLADLRVKGKVGFFDTAPVAKPTVTGSRASGAALSSLLTALSDATLGLFTDTTTA